MSSLEIAAIVAAGCVSIAAAIVAKCRFRMYEDENGERHLQSSCLERDGDLQVQELDLQGIPLLIVYPRRP